MISTFRFLTAAGSFAIAVSTIPALAVTHANPHAAPAIAAHGTDLGRETPTAQLDLTVWLKLHNRADLDAKVKDLYTKGSPTYHQWMTQEQLRAYMPTAADRETVRRELEAYHLKVVSSDKEGMYFRIQGNTSDVENAFQTQIHRTKFNGEMVHTTTALPALRGEAGRLMFDLGGVDAVKAKSYIRKPINPLTQKPFEGKPYVKGKPDGLYYTAQCFYPPSTISGSGVSEADGTTAVSASYTGLGYGANPGNTAEGTLSPCGYQPTDIYGFYGLNSAYNAGYMGNGQSIVIVDAYTEPNANPDLATFSTLYNLPAPTSANYAEYFPDGPGASGVGSGWDGESDLDLQWSHAIAPNASLAFVQTYSDDWENLQHGVLYAIENKLGTIISGSFGDPETSVGPYIIDTWDQIAEMGAAQGISIHFSSGDDGDYSAVLGYTDVSMPSDSQYVTSVGGTSIGVDPDNGNVFHFGWGNNLAALSDPSDGSTNYIYDPPATEFYAGGGGGQSSYIAKPAYQSALSGTGRQQPDVAAIADPYTGVEYVYTATDPTTGNPAQFVGVIGGTSLASPVFSGMYALAQQAYGHSLGQAAPLMAEIGNEFLLDVTPLEGPYNTYGSVTDPSGTTNYTAAELSAPLEGNNTSFISAIWNVGGGQYLNVSFETDTSLSTAKGWDNVTGYGTPQVANFFNNFSNASAAGAKK